MHWKTKAIDEPTVFATANHTGLPIPIARALALRGHHRPDEIEAFLDPRLGDLSDPFLLPDMQKAVSRLWKAIAASETITVFGDYDVDGTTAVSLVYSFFKEHFKVIDYYIPDRYEEGYGISQKGIDFAAEGGFSLVIALDCGIKAVERIEYAGKKGVEFIICDHHNPGEGVPNAVAVLDPKQPGCNYPYKDLSGCGVGKPL